MNYIAYMVKCITGFYYQQFDNATVKNLSTTKLCACIMGYVVRLFCTLWWRHDIEMVSASLALHESSVDPPHERPLICFFVIILNNKRPRRQWFETLWRLCDVTFMSPTSVIQVSLYVECSLGTGVYEVCRHSRARRGNICLLNIDRLQTFRIL